MNESRTEVISGGKADDWAVTIETLGTVHDRTDANMSDPPPHATGDSQPDGDGLNHPE